jgi:hypothetical protein
MGFVTAEANEHWLVAPNDSVRVELTELID